MYISRRGLRLIPIPFSSLKIKTSGIGLSWQGDGLRQSELREEAEKLAGEASQPTATSSTTISDVQAAEIKA